MAKTKTIKSLDDIRGREKNPNRGTDRGRELTKASLSRFGAGRSVVVDASGDLIAGHTTTESFKQIAKPEDVIVVQTDGTKLVIVQRTDLLKDDPRAQMLAAVDNLTSNAGYNPDPDIMAEMGDDLFDAGFIDQREYDQLYADGNENLPSGDPAPASSPDATINPDTSSQLGGLTYRIVLDCKDEQHQAELLARFETEGLACRALIS